MRMLSGKKYAFERLWSTYDLNGTGLKADFNFSPALSKKKIAARFLARPYKNA
jgi:hypothetical protein